MKRVLSLFTAAVLLFSIAWPSRGLERPAVQEEAGYRFYVLSSGLLSGVVYVGEPDHGTVYVPKTLAGVTLTLDNFTGSVFCNGEEREISAFRVDADNAYFTTIDDALYTKDGTIGVAYPNTGRYAVYAVPEGTRELWPNSFRYVPADCLRMPASLTGCPSNAIYYRYRSGFQIASVPGSVGEALAAALDVPFVPLGEGHVHTYFQSRKEETCVDSGWLLVQCPCGEVHTDVTYPPDASKHDFPWTWDRETGSFSIGPCIYCGKDPKDAQYDPYGGCQCACHRYRSVWNKQFDKETFLSDLPCWLYPLRLFVWRILNIRKTCACGARHY